MQPEPFGQDTSIGHNLALTGELVRRPPNGSRTLTVQKTLLLAVELRRTIAFTLNPSESSAGELAVTAVVVVVVEVARVMVVVG